MHKTHGWMNLIVVSVILFSAGWAWTEDWPQWRGLNRDGLSKETGLLKEWPKEGPKLLWQVTDLGSGYATPAVAGGRIYLMCNKGLEDEFVKALDVKDGNQVWSTRIGKVGNPDQKPNFPAARSTPTVEGDGDLRSGLRWRSCLPGIRNRQGALAKVPAQRFRRDRSNMGLCRVAAGGWQLYSRARPEAKMRPSLL